MYSNFVKLFPEAGELVEHLLDNRVYFQTVLEQEMDQDGSGNATATINPAVTSIDPHVSDQASRAARAGEGKTFTEREGVKAATRARFRALVEKHEFSKLGDAFDKVAKQPTFRALMENSNSSTNGTNEPLPPLPRFSSESLPDLTSIENSRRTLLAVAAAGVRDVALAAGASAKKLRMKSIKQDVERG